MTQYPKFIGLKKNRELLLEDICNTFDNIDTFKGQFLFFNHDVGTGKTTKIINNIYKLIEKNKRILILSASYRIIEKEWSEVEKQYEDITYTILSTSKLHLIDCPEVIKNPYSTKYGIDQFIQKYCNSCNEHTTKCLKYLKDKIKRQIVICTYAMLRKNSHLFNNFDIVIFDEATCLDEIVTYHVDSEFCKPLARIKKPIKIVKDIVEGIKKQSYEYFNNYQDGIFNDISYSPLYMESIFTEIKLDKVKIIEVLKIEKKNNRFAKNQEYKKILTKLLKIIQSDNPIIRMRKHVIKEVKSRNKYFNYYKNKHIPAEPEIKCRYHIDISIFKESTLIILSAVNTVEYIQNLFNHKVDNIFGGLLYNRYINVIAFSYARQQVNKLFIGNSKTSYRLNPNVYFRINNTIDEFIKHYKGEKIAIIGHTSLYQTLETDIKSMKNGRKLVRADKYGKNREDGNNSVNSKEIPFIHYGMSGINSFSDIRAALVISIYHSNPSNCVFYQNKSISKHILDDDTYSFNTNIATMRQAEGRIYRFSKDCKIKYIHRLIFYDNKNYSMSYLKRFPDFNQALFVLGRQESIINLFSLPDCYNQLSRRMQNNINTNLYEDILSDLNIKNMKEWTYITAKYIEFIMTYMEIHKKEYKDSLFNTSDFQDHQTYFVLKSIFGKSNDESMKTLKDINDSVQFDKRRMNQKIKILNVIRKRIQEYL